MRTTKRLLVIAAVLAVPLWVAGSAVGDVDCDNEKFAENPQCATTTPPESTTTVPDDPPPPTEEPACGTVNPVPFERTWVQFDCAWTPDDDWSPIGTVGVDADGEVVYLVIAVRDSSPGDYCLDPVIWDGKGLGTHFEASFDLVRGIEPYWLHPTNWCGDREDLNGDPLTVTVNARVKRNTDLTVTLDPSQIP